MSVHELTPLPVALPLLAAAAIVVTSSAPRLLHDVLATATAAAMTVLCAILVAHSQHRPIVEWLGGWIPHHGVASGIALTADQLGAGCALLASGVVTVVLVYSRSYFDDVDAFVYPLMLTLSAGMAGVCLSGDLFTMVVFFVLMTVPGIALVAVENEHQGPLQGALNFGVLNAIAGFAALMATGLVYGRTGALNLAQIAASLDHHPPDALVAVAVALLLVAFLTKAGAAPFHFWLPDANAVAPTPASALFSGAVVITALFAVARVLATAFGQPLAGHEPSVRALIVGIGVVSAVVAAFACAEQRHLKRLLAFATVQQVGVTLCGIGLLRSDALAGAALAAVGAGLTLAALFMAGGVLIRRHSTTDEFELYGRGRDRPFAAAALVVGAFTLAAVPFTTGFGGSALIADGARAVGYDWLPLVIAVTSAIAAGSVLRAGARIFFGVGTDEPHHPHTENEDRSQQQSADEEEHDAGTGRDAPLLLGVIPVMLLAVVVALGVLPGFSDSVQAAAAHFRDVHSYMRVVLRGAGPDYAPVVTKAPGASAFVYSLGSLAGACVVAGVGLRGRRLLPAFAVDALRGAHSGHVGDYTAWWTFGMATVGGLALWAIAG